VLIMAGASGVGSSAIQIAKQLGARVITTCSTPEKQDLALRLGADFVLDAAKPSWIHEVRNITKKRGVDLAIEHIGGDMLEQCFHCLARGGSIVTCGATAGRIASLNLWPFFVKQQRLIGSYGRNRTDLSATLEWAQSGRLKPVIDRCYPLKDTLDAYKRLRSRQTLGKLVILPL
jgi:NADPH:quinone reductase-like Zn-dependent oxidoreductase